jgi:dsRNA-specific ribonuclease
VLGLAITTHLYPRLQPDAYGAGRLTKVRAQAVSGRSCRDVAERLGMGEVLSIYRPVTPSRSPYLFQPSHQAILSTVAANQTYWAYWEASPSTKVLEKAWAGVALGNAQQLRK